LSPVFRHGSLRLYLLRLLDEEPRHGYEVIRLLRDRFMGVYSPSPGTIYPRLARLEEEGLVTHDEVEGRKVYRITEAGREELRNRSDELDELEEELSASVNDIVREVKEDVRQTVRSLREELTWAARESRRASREMADEAREQARQARDDTREEARQAREEARQAREEAREEARQAQEDDRQARDDTREEARQAREDARQQHEERHRAQQDAREETHARVRQAREELREQARRAREGLLGHESARRVHEHAQRLVDEAHRLREEAGASRFAGDEDWGQGWTGWQGRRGWEEWTRLRGHGGWSSPLDVGTLRDLERLAVQFTAELRRVALQSSFVGENVIGDLRTILEEALDRIKTEIFGTGTSAGADRDDNPEE
jgi:DNA-binding PadR family transcriptional regulator